MMTDPTPAVQPGAPMKLVKGTTESRLAALEAAFASLAELHFKSDAGSLEVVGEWLESYESEHSASPPAGAIDRVGDEVGK